MDGFADIEGPLSLGLMPLIAWIALGVLALLLAGLALKILRKRRSPAEEGPAVPLQSPLEIAIERLHRLQGKSQKLEAEVFTVEVSDIVRDYLELALRIPAKEQTSEEFLQAVQIRKDAPEILKTRMPRFLDHCDLVKFARQILGEAQREALLETAGTVVRETDASLAPPKTTQTGKEDRP